MITILIIIICTIIFLYINIFKKDDKGRTAMKLGAFYPPYVRDQHQYYRMITCHFIHVDFMHWFMNMYCIYSLGSFFEGLLGTIGYLVLILLSMLTASFMCLSVANLNNRYERTITIGASGIFYGYLGAIIGLALLKGGGYIYLLREFMFVILINIFFTLFNQNISKTGHLGGMIGGIMAIIVLVFIGYI